MPSIKAYGEMTIVQVDDGQDGKSGTSPFFIDLQNDSQNIPCNSDGITSTSFLIDIPITTYEGVDIVPCEITVGLLPSGITVGNITNCTSSKSGKVTLNVANGSNLGGNDTGNITITCKIKGSSIKELSKTFTWLKTKDGEAGKNPVFYSVVPSVDVLKRITVDTNLLKDENGNVIEDETGVSLYESSFANSETLSPSSVTFTSYSQEANKDRESFLCRFIIMESQDGTSYSTKYTSSKDESSVIYSPSKTDLNHIKCIMCKPGGITEQLDSQTVLILHDATGYDEMIKTMHDRFSSISFQLDNDEKTILMKATQQDIINTINEYDNTSIKTIRDQQTEQKIEIGKISSKVSDVESITQTKADGSTVTELNTRLSKAEQDAEGFKRTVESNYGTKEEIATIKEQADKLETSVKNNEGEISVVKQKANELDSTISSMSVGGANLIVNSNNLIFDDYYFIALLIDENNVGLVDEDNNKIVTRY